MTTSEHEADRLALIRSLDLLALQGEPDLDRITRLAAQALGAPMALITVLEEFEQHFISTAGTDLQATEREISVCAVAIEFEGVFEVEDLSQDARFAHFRTVTEDGMRFYAGAPLTLSTGVSVGTLCIVDFEPRRLSATQLQILRTFADLAVNQIQLLRMLGRRDAVTGLPNRLQMAADLASLEHRSRLGRMQMVVIDVLEPVASGRLTQALGAGPAESIVRQAGFRIADLLPDTATLYHVDVARFAFFLADEGGDGLLGLLAALRKRVMLPVHTHGLDVSAGFHAGLAPFDGDSEGEAMRMAVTAVHAAIERGLPWSHYDAARDAALRRQHTLAIQVETGPCASSSSACSTSRGWTCGPAGSNGPKRCCAGSIRCSARSDRTNSCRSSRRPR